MKILAIETSCDETAIALIEAKCGLRAPQFKVFKNIVASQIETHRPWGGVVPNLAKREHIKNLPIIFNKILRPSGLNPDILAVTIGPGLEPCLWSGIEFTKEIYKKHFPKAKLIGANHLEGHLYSFLLSPKAYRLKPNALFPAIALIVSGGHTILLVMKSLTEWQKLGETRDDAVGEAFDKVGRMLELPFPGGPEIEKLAAKGNSQAINFPRPMINTKNYDFSFSGLKTSVFYYLADNPNVKKADIAASFQQAAIDVLVVKTIRAAKEFKAKSIMLSGGVAANKLLRKTLRLECKKLHPVRNSPPQRPCGRASAGVVSNGVNFFAPAMKFNTDNAAMIAAAAYINYLRKKNRKIRAQANLNL